ncbi:MAG: helix-turn-helix transcriptional regulator, partial [Actinobacteria bacterium]|nr:helix-turn-helix transcriptional regulator [Actinomycetota bacterium]
FLSSARLAAGDVEGARAAAREEVELGRRFGAARPLGTALRAAGVAEGGKAGLELLAEAVATLRRSPSRLELARALVEYGAAVRRHGARAQAREPLREGLEMAQGFGAVVLERRAHEELVASGARPRRRELSGVDSLTPSERRVAELAAAGMTNREIAQRLFVTVKAVQWHLRHVYGKLEVQGREELARALGQQRRGLGG